MSSSLAEYLAKNYLTADPPKKKGGLKKRKRKEKDAATTSSSSGLIIADDDAAGWENTAANSDDDDGPTISGMTKSFKKSTTSNWKTIGGASEAAETAAADAILAANTDGRTEDDAPTVADDSLAVKMSSGAHAGLQTAAQIAVQMARAKEEERRRFEATDPAESGKGQETIYRDASGRIINIAMQRAEARKKIREEEEKKEREKEMVKGDVQKLQSEERAKRLEDAKYMTLARYADDTELNDELKDRERWADPAAAFLTKKKGGGTSKTGKPLFAGAAQPNRFSIRPGHRWDGVDRANGFEAKWFQAQNRKNEKSRRAYETQMDLD
ncbi:Pre-mRNA-splicing factor of RES complex-domain-containing protein [Tricharina praecox]|uniref:Pre-mRNA-splicing factor of RES complex-domain-containing protein n=1 Tax=Tricharina praecox TaxID=43433 RepID=UPI00221F72D8|nr:Pre-mRNA-splicing factor of RES complex-domain-containing protein [Tricharina praecox]KAI5842722.1 Pre-mRNA-splicing factor of RES complex-domain-containing protein [Tricharina praecox]